MADDQISGSSMRHAKRNIEAVIEGGEEAARVGLNAIGLEAVNTIRLLVTRPSPSAPGTPPGLIFGGLRLSYEYEVAGNAVMIGSDASTRRPVTGEAVDYAKYQEEGTRHMPARPHLRPAMAIIVPQIPVILSRTIAGGERAVAATLRGISIG